MKKRTSFFKYFIPGIVIEYCMYLLAGSWGGTIYEILPRLEKVMSNPLGWYFNKYTIIFLLIGIGITFIWYLFDITKPTMMPGKEYGTAQWGDIHSIEKQMIEKGNVKEIRQYSESFKISTNSDFTGCNNNVFIVGGSGTRKSWSGLQPNVWLENGSMLITDPKGELLARNGKKLIQDGYIVRVLDLIDMKLSDRYNPFSYIRESADIPRMVDCIIRSTSSEKGKKKTGGDPFWENSESLFLQALFYYVWMEEPECNRSMRRVMELLAMAKYSDDGIPSDLDEIMDALAIKKENHPAVRKYNEVMNGAGDTVRSIIISVHVRMALFEEEDVLRIFDADDFQIGTFGSGINMDGKTKTAVFIKIPDNDKTYNFIASMFYMQACRELYRLADQVYHGKLPIPVTFWFDEFANIVLPDDFLAWIATCRSRNLSCVIIIQNLAQIKAMYDKEWDTIPGNCDVLLYLGGNEQTTHEYISKLLGKQTIYKRNTSETRGNHGSSSRTLDVLGRDLMTADEVGSLSNEKCIIKVRGCYPIIDNKYVPFNKANFAMLEKLGVYVHEPIRDNQYFKILTPQELEACERDALLMPDRIQITSMTIEELCRLVEIAKQQLNQDHHIGTIKNIPVRQAEKIVHGEQQTVYKGNSLTDILSKYILDDGKMDLIKKGVNIGLTDEQVICVLNKTSEEWESYLALFKEMNARKVAN